MTVQIDYPHWLIALEKERDNVLVDIEDLLWDMDHKGILGTNNDIAIEHYKRLAKLNEIAARLERYCQIADIQWCFQKYACPHEHFTQVGANLRCTQCNAVVLNQYNFVVEG